MHNPPKFVLVSLVTGISAKHFPNVYDPEQSHIIHPLPHTYIAESDLPQSFTWQNVSNRFSRSHWYAIKNILF